ncbi:MAG: RNA polymerase sigma factor [Planctomycetota bacterium]
MPADLRDLVQRAQSGDRHAYDELASTQATARLRRYLTTMTGDEHAAEDLVQDSLQRGFERLDQLQVPERFSSWLLSIACNACRSHLRREVQRGYGGGGEGSGHDPAISQEAPAAAQHSALSSLVRREDAVRLQLAIDRLPILLREAFVLFAVEGCPYSEIAVVTACSEGTLQVRVHRAKTLLRQQLGAVFDTWIGTS